MTRKDYNLIAEAMAEATDNCADDSQVRLHAMICRTLADHLELDNSRFDSERFMAACNAVE